MAGRVAQPVPLTVLLAVPRGPLAIPRTPEWNAVCEGTTAENGIYGEGIVSATRAVGAR